MILFIIVALYAVVSYLFSQLFYVCLLCSMLWELIVEVHVMCLDATSSGVWHCSCSIVLVLFSSCGAICLVSSGLLLASAQ